METLREKQSRFVKMQARLIDWAYAHGYELTLGDGFRDPRVFGDLGVHKGYGKAYSNHKRRLAQDYNLFKDGKFLSSTEDHRPLGEYWESIGGAWGGHFNDGNHYALEHEGRV